MSMSLSSVGYAAWNTIRGVRFTMLYGQTLVPVLVTHDALDDVEREHGPIAELTDAEAFADLLEPGSNSAPAGRR